MMSDNDNDDHGDVWSQPSDENLSTSSLIITLNTPELQI